MPLLQNLTKINACLLTFVLAIVMLSAHAQKPTGTPATTTTAPASVPAGTVVLDFRTKMTVPAATAIPIDRRFYLQIIDSVPTNNIRQVNVFATTFKYGKKPDIADSVLKLKVQGTTRYSFQFRPNDIAIDSVGQKITLSFPAMRPEKDFDIFIRKGLSPKNVARALTINQVLDSSLYRDLDVRTADSVTLNQLPLRHQLKTLRDSTDNPQFGGSSALVFLGRRNGQLITVDSVDTRTGQIGQIPKAIYSISLYKDFIYNAVKDYYTNLETAPVPSTGAGVNGFAADRFLDQDDMNAIALALKSASFENRVFVLQKLLSDPAQVTGTLFNSVLVGTIGMDYGTPKKYANIRDFTGRIKILSSSGGYLDSLTNALWLARANENVADADSKVLKQIRKIMRLRADITHNLQVLKLNSARIYATIIQNSEETLWIIGNTVSPDLQTLGGRRFTVDAGALSIFTHDNTGAFKPLLKLAIMGDYYLTSIDKNVDFKYIRKPDAPSDTANHYLESRWGLLERTSISFGVTLGSFNNTSFTDVYSTFSFVAGINIVAWHGVKFGGGVAWLKRYDNNPLLALQTKDYFAPYVSVTLDYDLIGVLSNLTSEIFK